MDGTREGKIIGIITIWLKIIGTVIQIKIIVTLDNLREIECFNSSRNNEEKESENSFM